MRHLALWWGLLEALGLLALPLGFRYLSPSLAHGYPFAKTAAILFVTAVSWVLGMAGLPLRLGIATGLVLLFGTGAAVAWQQRKELVAWLRRGGVRTLLWHDAVWTGAFLFFAWQRSLAPDIFGAEKYMDFAFLNALARADTLPPPDPWMATKPFHYYYLGYLSFAHLVRLSGIPPAVAYNLCIATVAGLSFAAFVALGERLASTRSAGLLAGAIGLLLGNLDGFLQFAERGHLVPIDYWRSSRVVGRGDTINEFPFFSTIHGDLHPHFQVMPVTLFFLALLLDRRLFAEKEPYRSRPGLFALWFTFTCMLAFSPWELPVGALTMVLLLQRSLPLFPLFSRERLLCVGAALGVAAAAYLPLRLGFETPPLGGVGVKLARTKLSEFLTVFGHLLLPLAWVLALEIYRRAEALRAGRDFLLASAALLVAVGVLGGNAVLPLLVVLLLAGLFVWHARPEESWRAPLGLGLAALAALLACEVVYLRDSYGLRLYRMNTVFKLYFQSWLLLSPAAAWAVLSLARIDAPRLRQGALAATAVLFLGACFYPVGLTRTRLGSPWPRTLDGNAYLAREHPDDFAAIEWLRENVRGLPVVLEATGDPYSYYARISSNTGLPTVMGWANHEGLWRGHDPDVEKARKDVLRIYQAPTLGEVAPLLDAYGVRYVVVGELERKDYGEAGLAKFRELPVAFSHGGTTVYEWSPGS
ncbi:MAG: hypothetical protein KatS3mg076_0499 [Candidatus Binatia bacterium]|nr:MAG: hypothetical protein KatS3mg076_0499 [Candidatus Binatia bacterium]